jgi:hypothetical protein
MKYCIGSECRLTLSKQPSLEDLLIELQKHSSTISCSFSGCSRRKGCFIGWNTSEVLIVLINGSGRCSCQHSDRGGAVCLVHILALRLGPSESAMEEASSTIAFRVWYLFVMKIVFCP